MHKGKKIEELTDRELLERTCKATEKNNKSLEKYFLSLLIPMFPAFLGGMWYVMDTMEGASNKKVIKELQEMKKMIRPMELDKVQLDQEEVGFKNMGDGKYTLETKEGKEMVLTFKRFPADAKASSSAEQVQKVK